MSAVARMLSIGAIVGAVVVCAISAVWWGFLGRDERVMSLVVYAAFGAECLLVAGAIAASSIALLSG